MECDLFHEKLSDEAIAAVFGVMAACPQHTFQVLTKRPERMRQWFGWISGEVMFGADCTLYAAAHELGDGSDADEERQTERLRERSETIASDIRWPLPNVWLGVSVEDQATADERIPLLLQTPAAKRFVSYEPALGPVDFRAVPDQSTRPAEFSARYTPLGDLDWIIVGGESGPGARPFDIEWARSVVEQCRAAGVAGVAVFVKQLGSKPHWTQGPGECEIEWILLRHSKGGEMSEWPEDLRVREFPTQEEIEP